LDITVKSKGCDVSERVKSETVQRVNRAVRFFDRLQSVQVVFSEAAGRKTAAGATVEVTARLKGTSIRAVGAGNDHRAAMDAAVGRFERQLARHKTQRLDRLHGRAYQVATAADERMVLPNW
jgi:ribosomal subunit interface protein